MNPPSKLGPNGIRDDRLIETIHKILLENIDNHCGGLFVSEIERELAKQEIHVSTQRITQLIMFQGKYIKIHPIQLDTKRWINLYYATPQLNLNKEAPE